jgi:hypothetical protein
MASLSTDYNRFLAVTTTLLDISQRSQSLEFEYQKLIAETLILRLFYELDKCIECVVLKLLSGSCYLDSTTPSLLLPTFKSQEAARQYIFSLHKKMRYLEWTTLTKIKTQLANIMDTRDHFLITRDLYDLTYEEMRFVRNHVAHNTASTKAKFTPIAHRVFMTSKGISPSKLLISDRNAIASYTGTERVIAQYIRWARVFIKVITKSPT